MGKKHIPIIVGAAQFTQRKDTPKPLDSLGLMVKTGEEAMKDTGVKNINEYIDAVYMVNISSWSYEDAPAELSKKLNIIPKEKIYLPDGGHSPQMLVNRAAKAITSGKHRSILITGGEAAYSINRKFKKEHPKYWPEKKDPKYINGEKWDLSTINRKYGLYWPSFTYGMFETALRASSGRSVEEHRKYMGELMERFSKVASKNPYSWTQKAYSADEITTPSPKNRLITYPYTKRMCANNFVDQAGTIIISSEAIAKSLHIDKKHWVYVMGGATLKNISEIYQRPKLDDSPAFREGVRVALDQAGLKLDDIDKFDLYSCFPSIVEIFIKELGIKEDDPRDLTVTGGLPYFGTPLSNYSLHAIINTIEIIRSNPSLKVMVVANGGYNTKESIGIYGNRPPKEEWGTRDDSEIQESILKESLPDIPEKANGKLTVEGYSIIYDRIGELKRAVLVGKLENGNRALAVVIDPKILSRLEDQEIVGKNFLIEYDPKIDRNIVLSME